MAPQFSPANKVALNSAIQARIFSWEVEGAGDFGALTVFFDPQVWRVTDWCYESVGLLSSTNH
jgi:hypothetical protein